MAEREKGTGNRIPGRPNSRSEEDAAEREKGTGKRIPGRLNSRSEKDVAERERGTGNRIPGRQNSRSEKDLAEREMGSQERANLQRERAAGPGGQVGAEEEGTRNDKEPPSEEATKQLSVLGEHIPKEAKPETGQRKTLEVKYCKIPSGIRTTPSNK